MDAQWSLSTLGKSHLEDCVRGKLVLFRGDKEHWYPRRGNELDPCGGMSLIEARVSRARRRKFIKSYRKYSLGCYRQPVPPRWCVFLPASGTSGLWKPTCWVFLDTVGKQQNSCCTQNEKIQVFRACWLLLALGQSHNLVDIKGHSCGCPSHSSKLTLGIHGFDQILSHKQQFYWIKASLKNILLNSRSLKIILKIQFHIR